MRAIKAISRLGLPRRTACLQGWKNNLKSAAHFRRGSKNGFNLAPRSWSGDYLRRLQIARMC